jgi:hypothetical protein
LVEACFKIRQIQTLVQCGHKWYAAPAQERDVQPVGMAMDDVELADPVCETLQHDGIGEHGVELTGI